MQCLNHCYLFPSCIVIQCKIENCASLMITVNRLAGNIFNLIHIYLDSFTQCMLSIKALQFYVEPLICSSPSHLPTLNLWSDSPIHSLQSFVNLSTGHVPSRVHVIPVCMLSFNPSLSICSCLCYDVLEQAIFTVMIGTQMGKIQKMRMK